jgi:hypothetical protein
VHRAVRRELAAVQARGHGAGPEGAALGHHPRRRLKQYAFKGKPLYYWKNDKKAGEASGHAMNNVWFAAKP